MKFSFIIPAHEYVELTKQCLTSFFVHHGKNHELIVVDDGSKPETKEFTKSMCAEMGVKFLSNDHNLGFAKTVNKGLRAATGDVLVLTNNDVIFTRPVTEPMERAFLSDPKIGIVGALLLYPHGTVQHGGIVRIGRYGFSHRGWHAKPDNVPDVHKSSYFLAVTGALMAIKRDMYTDIGALNEEYFMSCEDTMYCIRAWQSGWKVFYSGDTQAIHAEGGTRGNTDAIKMVKGRQWFLKEKETQGVFLKQIQNVNFPELDIKIREANDERHRGAVLKVEPPNPYSLSKTEFIPAKKPERAQFDSAEVIGINRTGALGDVLMATGIVRKIKEQFPDKKVVFATACPDALRKNPNIDAIVGSRSELKADRIFDLDLVYEKKPKMPVVSAYSLEVFGEVLDGLMPELYSDHQDLHSARQKLGGKLPNRMAVLHMGVGWQNRTWPRQSWVSVVRGLVTQGYSVITVGRGADFRSDLFSNVHNMVDRFTIPEIREVIRTANVFVGVDSGLLHVAQTTSTPIVGLFTCANPEFRIVRKNAVRAVVPKVDCRFCLHDEPPPVTFVGCKRGDYKCLSDIAPEAVVAAINEVQR